MARSPVYALILAGGAGTRFWPASRANRPKQLLPLTGGDALLVETVRRVLGVTDGIGRVMIASGKHLAAPTRALLPDLPYENLLVEPVPRNTAPCIALGAARIARLDPDGIVMVLPSDHHITNTLAYSQVLDAAVASARAGVVTTIGIKPTHPETGYGYIEIESASASSALAPPGDTPLEALPVLRFVEKPDRARAETFLASGRFFWNAGMFFFRAGAMMEALRAHQPAIWEGVSAIAAAGPPGSDAEVEALERLFPTLPSVSIDHGVMEHLGALAVVPGDFGWSDLGSWHSAWELADKDAHGNASPADAIRVDAAGNQIVDLRSPAAHKRVIAIVGVANLVVVETDDALLIVPRDRAQDVKLVVDALKARGDGGLT